MYLDPASKFPETKEKPGYFVGFAKNSGDALTYKVLKDDMKIVLVRSVVRAADTIKDRNRRVTFRDEIEDEFDKLDENFKHNKLLKPAVEDKSNEDDSDSDSDEEEQGIHSRTRSKRTRNSFQRRKRKTN